MTGEEFIKKAGSRLTSAVGALIAQSIMKNNLAKLKKDVGQLAEEDFKILIENITKSVALFETKDESKQLKADLEGLLKAGA
jgi:hypothetical protein